MNSDDQSEVSGNDLMATFKNRTAQASRSKSRQTGASVSPANFISDDSSTDDFESQSPATNSKPTGGRRLVAVANHPVLHDKDLYERFEVKEVAVAEVLDEVFQKGVIEYEIRLSDGRVMTVDYDQLVTIDNGLEAFEQFQEEEEESDEEQDSSSRENTKKPKMKLRPKVKPADRSGFVDFTNIDLDSDDDDDELDGRARRPQQARLRRLRSGASSSRSRRSAASAVVSLSSDSSDKFRTRRPKRNLKTQEPIRRSSRKRPSPAEQDDEDEDEDDSSSSLDILRSDVIRPSSKRKRTGRGTGPTSARASAKPMRAGVRQSERSTRATNNMKEAEIGDIYRSESSEPTQTSAPKVTLTKEVIQPLPRNNPFRLRHLEACDTCGQGPNIAPLVYCQGCSLAYHKNCLGHRAGREHLVTKIGHEDFVMQCRRCLNVARSKDPTAPDLAKCQDCKRSGPACKAFKKRKSTQQEQKDREENGGIDPVTYVSGDFINNPKNVLFRCTMCYRGFHYHHLPSLSPYAMDIGRDEEEIGDERFHEYSKDWKCKDCEEVKNRKVGTIIAWRPSDVENYVPGTSCEDLNEDDKQYLLKWEKQSYFRASWHSGSWTWGVTASAMRKAFYKRDTGPKMRTEDAIPEEYLRIDIVLNVKFTSIVDVKSEEIDKARIKEVDEALIKYKGLGYEDAVWEKVPVPEDGDRWLDFVTAYNDWVAGRYVRIPKQAHLKARLEKARGKAFAKLEKEKQPDNLVGGELMKYQIDGLNWLYYQWYSQNNGILADEMGLGKTIQVIGFMATLIQDHNAFPFLVVVPNSTCANWRREIKQWVPSLRVVTFFGSAQAREMAYKYQLFPEGSKDLRCHIVVTSYEAAADDSCKKVFRSVQWAGLIVDEGQRLKNDKSQLYGALNAVRAPFRLLLTGTPLQNNARELFNLLQFLDDSIKAAELEEKYAEMTTENVKELHDKIRPYILRRTKVQVLTFLPPLGQIIVPISMSTLQKKLYKSILAKNPELLKALFSTSKALKQQERANLSNILMQLRKCLCHPFVYSREIEERTDVAAVSHRNLVEASAKLQLLELLLPKLKERGHRVLIFSQFLDMLSIIEDFLDGMGLEYQRLDGTIGSLEKQKRIDQFNAPASPLFAFLLSTRAGGVGINLATADTVIILDPDFNPHQDIQAISRAHRIGQKKKVLCFQLMTRSSVEEKIVQMGRKKMALDHVVVEQLDADDIEDQDVESILKHGAAELFKDDNADHDIRFDDSSIDKLLDRSQIENTKTGGDDSAETQFSFARVWANDQGTLADTLETHEAEEAPDPGVWDRILKERQAAAAADALARAEALGRGKRSRMNVDYNLNEKEVAENPSSAKPERRRRRDDESDTDFHDDSSEDERNVDEEVPAGEVDPRELAGEEKSRPRGTMTGARAPQGARDAVAPFKRAHLPERAPFDHTDPNAQYFSSQNFPICSACRQPHPRGACPLKIAGSEHCGLCGLAHYGYGRACPHINSETQVRDMLEALKNSPEQRPLVDAAVKYLRGVKGTLVQKKKKDREKGLAMVVGGGAGGVGSVPVLRAPQQALGQSNGNAAVGQQGQGRPVQDDDAAVESALLGYLGR